MVTTKLNNRILHYLLALAPEAQTMFALMETLYLLYIVCIECNLMLILKTYIFSFVHWPVGVLRNQPSK